MYRKNEKRAKVRNDPSLHRQTFYRRSLRGETPNTLSVFLVYFYIILGYK